MKSIEVVVVRPNGTGEQIPDGAGGYLDAPELPIPGSPFQCCFYRRTPSYKRDETGAGTSTIDERILSFLDPNAPIEIGDIALIPPCLETRNKPLRVTIHFPRPYPNGLQCDIEAGATPAAPDTGGED